MTLFEILFKSPARRKAEQDQRRREALRTSKTALRREARAIEKQRLKIEETRREAVAFQRQGQTSLVKQKVRQLKALENQILARSLAHSNMEFALEQASTKTNYEDFLRAMHVYTKIEELVENTTDPEEVRQRIEELTEANADIMEPWIESSAAAGPQMARDVELTPEEQELYNSIVADAVGDIESEVRAQDSADINMDKELERKMDEALGKE